MMNFNEIKDFVLNFETIPLNSDEKLEKLKEIVTQLGYKFTDCKCRSLVPSLYQKAKTWLKNHPDGMCHYKLESGVLLFDQNNQAISITNFTDEKAQYLLETEYAKYVTQVLPFDDEKAEPLTAEQVNGIEKELEVAKQAKTGKRKITSKKK